jgi:hypothetical protein
MTEENPIVLRQKEEEARQREKDAFRYPYRIVCVYHAGEGYEFPIVKEVQEYCAKNHMAFSGREYNVDKYAEEDLHIRKLPAFHMYHKKWIYETMYFDNNPVHKIQTILWAYQDEEKKRERLRQRRLAQWNAIQETVSSIFSLERFKRKPALDMEACLSHSRIKDSSA